MLIGVPKEIKSDEYRIGLTPESVKAITEDGHEVMILSDAGLGIGKTNEEYQSHGAIIIDTREEIFEKADLVLTSSMSLYSEKRNFHSNISW